MDFVRRLGFALSLYMDVYTDRRVQVGEYPTSLYNEIDARDFFLFVMTPYSLAGDWPQKDLAYARSHEKPIALARVYAGEGTSDPRLDSKYLYANFSEDF